MKAITREEKIMSGENLTPITRKEMFLAKASGQNIETPTPITREEYFLSKITGGGGSTNLPLAYTVSSVDELPSDAVDGSMAIVPSESIQGKWLFNDTLNFDALELPNNTGIRVGIFGYSDECGYFDYLWVRNVEGSISLVANTVGAEEYYLYFDDMWDGVSRITFMENEPSIWAITITENGIGDRNYPTAEEDVKTFITTNAERLSGGYSLYTHENGEWVYKCEVI